MLTNLFLNSGVMQIDKNGKSAKILCRESGMKASKTQCRSIKNVQSLCTIQYNIH